MATYNAGYATNRQSHFTRSGALWPLRSAGRMWDRLCRYASLLHDKAQLRHPAFAFEALLLLTPG